MTFYKIQTKHTYDKILYEYVHSFSEYCRKSEFQYLMHTEQCWKIPSDRNFEFTDFCYINNEVPLFSRWAWDMITAYGNTDGIFVIPVRISYQGEEYQYYIAVPPRIYCLDGRKTVLKQYGGIYRAENIVISLKETGRYNIFKIAETDDDSIYVKRVIADKLLEISDDFIIIKV